MGRHCKKCGYERRDGDIAPEYECPKCGAVYEKVEVRLKYEAEAPLRAKAKEEVERQDAGEKKSSKEDNGKQDQEPKRASMGYVESNLSPDERILAKGKIHWFVFVPPIMLATCGVFLVSAGSSIGDGGLIFGLPGALLLLASFISLLKAVLSFISTELAITTKRVIAKFGLISRETIELNHTKVESFIVHQGIFGRMLGFGTLTINGTGGVRTPIPSICNPLEFRRIANSQIEKMQSP